MKNNRIVLSIVATAALHIQTAFPVAVYKAFEETPYQDSSLELYAVKFSDQERNSDFEYAGKHLVKLNRKPLMKINGDFLSKDSKNLPSLQLDFNKKESRQFKKVSKRYLNHNFAFVQRGKVLTVATAKKFFKKLNPKISSSRN